MRRPWLIVGLVVSLALNLFLIGAAAGVIALGLRMASQNPARPGALLRASRDLPQPDRRRLRASLAETWRGLRPDVERSRALRIAAWSALGDPKADPAAVKAQLAESRQIDQATRAKAEERLVDAVRALPPADRVLFAQGMRRVLTPPAQPAPRADQPSPRAGSNAPASR